RTSDLLPAARCLLPAALCTSVRRVPVRARLPPLPRRADDLVELREAGRPAELFPRHLAARPQRRSVAGAPRADTRLDLAPAHAAHRVDDVPHAERAPDAEVVRPGVARIERVEE